MAWRFWSWSVLVWATCASLASAAEPNSPLKTPADDAAKPAAKAEVGPVTAGAIPGPAQVIPPVEKMKIMPVSQVRAGMEGVGRTVLQGTELVPFQVKILGVLKDVSPGRDLVLARLSGANLEHTGVIAGMSGSPVYIDGQLLGAVAYAWGFAKEPIAGITPFEQMRSQADAPKLPGVARIDTAADGTMPLASLDLSRDPLEALAESESVAVSVSDAALAGKQGRMLPISIPLSAGGFGPRSLGALGKHLAPLGIMPVASGRAPAQAQAQAQAQLAVNGVSQAIVPGGVLSCGLITGDMDLTGIGTVTHVEGNRVWGWGHPFMRSGECQYLMRGGFIHLVNANLNISTKMGSPLAVEGLITADVGSCVAGNLGAKPDMIPMEIVVREGITNTNKTYKCEIVRHEALLGPLVSTVLANSIEELGTMPAELTVELDAEIRAQGLEPIRISDIYSGASVSGNEGVTRLFGQLAVVTNGLTRNPFGPARIESITCRTNIIPKRHSASIESVLLKNDRLEPGDDLVAVVTLRPHKQDPVDVEVRLAIPESFPPGAYQATICDAGNHLRAKFTEEPYLLAARDVQGVAQAFRNQLTEKRQAIYLRVPHPDQGVSVDGVNLPQLPASAAAVFSSKRATPKPAIRSALVSKKTVDWAIEGNTTLRFTVANNKRQAP